MRRPPASTTSPATARTRASRDCASGSAPTSRSSSCTDTPIPGPAVGCGGSVRRRFCTCPALESPSFLHPHRSFCAKNLRKAVWSVPPRHRLGSSRAKSCSIQWLHLRPQLVLLRGHKVVLRRPPDALLDTGGSAQHLLVRLAARAAGVDTEGT